MSDGENSASGDFDIFWAAYPRKVKKGDARKAWAQVSGIRPPIGLVVAAIERARMCEQWCRDGGRYVPHPATWLRAEQWEDVHEVDVWPEHQKPLTAAQNARNVVMGTIFGRAREVLDVVNIEAVAKRLG